MNKDRREFLRTIGRWGAFGALLTDIEGPMVHDEDGNEVQMTLAS